MLALHLPLLMTWYPAVANGIHVHYAKTTKHHLAYVQVIPKTMASWLGGELPIELLQIFQESLNFLLGSILYQYHLTDENLLGIIKHFALTSR